MSLILVTGNTGMGKTALIVDWLAHGDRFKGRPLFVMGVPELTIDHVPCPPVDEWTEQRPSPEDPKLMLPYFTFPPNSVIWIDECQRVYRPRSSASKVPDYVAAFETHRHTGVDFILSTQHPTFMDAHARKLVQLHYHIHQSAIKRELLYWERPGGGDVDSKTDRQLAERSDYQPPKRAFGLYKSADTHTKIRRKIPKAVVMLGLALTFAVSAASFTVYRLNHRLNGGDQSAAESVPAQVMNGQVKAADSKKSQAQPVKTAGQYVAEMQPRIPGLLHTAPRYDQVTQVTDAPWPSCIERAAWRDKPAGCRCIDQQGNDYAMPVEQCRQIVAHGLFKDWGGKDQVREGQGDVRKVDLKNSPAKSDPVPVKVADAG
ncbi:MAG TPA: zonular occludens toxin domain-containing protein [Rhodocyclaceae bacterium]|nr:zonular occludens toxin domain-containing protein [Rhodocyclaceae bacterium]